MKGTTVMGMVAAAAMGACAEGMLTEANSQVIKDVSLETEFVVCGGGPAGLCAAIAAALTVFSLSHEPKSRLYRWTRRVFWAAALLLFSGAVGGVAM